MKNFLIDKVSSGRSKQFYTREEDESIVRLITEGKSIPEIAKEVGHSAASVTYRTNKLALMKSFSEYNYDTHRLNLTADEIEARKAEAANAAKATAQAALDES